jgi:DUF1126 PH-like domain
MHVAKESWVYRKQDGFKKTNSTGKIFFESAGRYPKNTMGYEFGGDSNSPSQSRPVTAPGIRMSGDLRRSAPSLQFTPYVINTTTSNDEYVRRPHTASTSMLRPSTGSTSRNNGFVLQSPVPQPVISRKFTKVPAFVETEKIVARFYGYFNYDRTFDRASALGHPSIRDADARYLTILFYVADETCEISETRAPNSGLEGGVFFKRARLIKADGNPLAVRDLAPGNVLHALGREIHIYDADSATRDFFR